MRHLKTFALAALLGAAALPAQAADWSAVATALGKAGTEMPGNVYRVGLPRTDLHVMREGIEIRPTFALGSWVAFTPMGNQTMVMGDLVLAGDEVEPVMKAILEGGLDVTAVHNHIFKAAPATFYMHIGGMGDAAAMARTIHSALALSKTPFTAPAAPASP